MRRFAISAGLVCMLGCGKGGDAAPAKGDKPAGDPNTWADYKVEGLPLKVTAPGDAEASPMGGISARSGACVANLHPTTASAPSFENTIHNIEAGNIGGALKEFKRKDKRDDQNWLIEWSTADKFGYESRRQVGGVTYSCGRVAASADGVACAIKICESLAPG